MSVVYVIKLMTTPGMSVTWMTEVFGALTSPPWKRRSKPGMNGARLWGPVQLDVAKRRSPSRKTTRNGRQRKSKYLECAPCTNLLQTLNKKMTDRRLPKIGNAATDGKLNLGWTQDLYFVKSKASYGWGGRDPPKKDANALFNILTHPQR